MNQALRDILAASPEATDAEIVALYNAPSGRVAYYANARTILDAMDTPQRAEDLLGYIRENMPATYAVLAKAGRTDGTDGGMDLSNDKTRTALAGFVTAGLANSDELGRLLALSDTYRPGAPIAEADVAAEKAAAARELAVGGKLAEADARYQLAYNAIKAWEADGNLPEPDVAGLMGGEL